MQVRYNRVILIDDDPISNYINARSIAQFCKQNGSIEIQQFTKPQEGIAYIENEYRGNQVKTLLLLDINMPVVNGWEVLKALKERNVPVAGVMDIYILSSSTDEADMRKASNEPLVKAYFEKPVHNHLPHIFRTIQNDVTESAVIADR